MRESGTRNYPAAFTHVVRTRPELFAQMQVPVGLPEASIARAANRLAAAANGEPLPPGAHWVTINGRHVLIDGEGEPRTDLTRHDAPGQTPEPPGTKAGPPPRDERGRFVSVDETTALGDAVAASSLAALQRWNARVHPRGTPAPSLLEKVNEYDLAMLIEVAKGFIIDGLVGQIKDLPRMLVEGTLEAQLTRLVQLLRQAAANPQGFWAGLKEIEAERLQAVLAKLKELTTTPRGAGELLFDVVSIWLGGEVVTAFKESELGVKLAAGLKEPAKPATTIVFRTESAKYARILVGPNGQVVVSGNKTLFLNFGSKARAEEFLAKYFARGEMDAQIKSFQVPESFLTDIQKQAVDEELGRKFPNSPQRVDVTKAPDQFSLRSDQIKALRKNIIQGSGKIH